MTDESMPAWSEPFTGTDRTGLVRPGRLDGVDRAWAFGGGTGRGVTVAIIDSGLERDHPRLLGRVVESVAVELVDGEPNIVADDAGDLFGHGTACGGIILGLAPEAELVSVRVLGADLKGKGAAFLAGLEWATERGVTLANLSLSSKSETLFPFFHEAVDAAYFRNVHLVSAANNVPRPELPVPVLDGLLGRGPRGAGSASSSTTTHDPRSSSVRGGWTCPSPGRTAARQWRPGTASRRHTWPATSRGSCRHTRGSHRSRSRPSWRRSGTSNSPDGEPSGLSERGSADVGSLAGRPVEERNVATGATCVYFALLRASFCRACSRAWRSTSFDRARAMSEAGARVHEHRVAFGVVPLIGRTHRLVGVFVDLRVAHWGSPGFVRTGSWLPASTGSLFGAVTSTTQPTAAVSGS